MTSHEEAAENQRRMQRDSQAAYTERLSKLNDEELRVEDLKQKDGTFRHLLEAEMRYRGIRKHWTLTPVFVFTFLAALFAGISAWSTIRGWLEPSIVKIVDPGGTAHAPQTKTTPDPSLTSPTAIVTLPAQATVSPSATPKSEVTPQQSELSTPKP